MTLTKEEEEQYEKFQRNRGEKMKVLKVTYLEKLDLMRSNRSKSHLDRAVGRPVQKLERKKFSPKKRQVLERIYKPVELKYGESKKDKKDRLERKKEAEKKEGDKRAEKVKAPVTESKGSERTKKEEKKQEEKSKRKVELMKLAAELETSSTSSQESPSLVISLNTEGQFSDVSDVENGDDEEEEKVVEGAVVEERREQPMEVSVTPTTTPPATPTVTPAGDAPTYEATDKKLLKLQNINRNQNSRFILNVGGSKFETCASTMSSDPNSILYSLIQKESPVKPYSVEGRLCYFLDRDPKHFPVILNYLRNSARLHSDMLPRELKHLRELQVECNYYELKHLELNVQRRILDLQHGHFI